MSLAYENSEPSVHEQPWVRKALQGKFAAAGAYDADHPMEWTVIDWLPRTGASVWFGPGATGKTQLLLSLALSLAGQGDERPRAWLGAKIARRGQILVLSAEDTHEHLLKRLGRLAKALYPQAAEDARRACSRIHLMSFLSMSENEFPQDAPTLFRRSPAKGWEPHERLLGIRHFIEEYNRPLAEDSDERIIGVVMDSATSMAGFESTDSDAATNLFFYLNRMCRKLDIFWSIIGHTQKAPNVDPARPRANSVARLRGSAMWSTAPRMVVEVRPACDVPPKKGPRRSETSPFRKVRPGALSRDMLIVDVAKANVPIGSHEPRYLIRNEDGVLEDVSAEVLEVLAKPEEDRQPANDETHDGVRTNAEIESFRLEAVAEFVRRAVGTEPGTRVVRDKLNTLLPRFSGEVEHLRDVTETRGNADNPRPRSLGLYLNQLVALGVLEQRGRVLKVADFGNLERAPEVNAA